MPLGIAAHNQQQTFSNIMQLVNASWTAAVAHKIIAHNQKRDSNSTASLEHLNVSISGVLPRTLFLKKNMSVQGSYSSYMVLKSGTS